MRLTPIGLDRGGGTEAPAYPNETVLMGRRNELATRSSYKAAHSQHECEKIRRMIEAATIVIAVFCGGILGALSIKAHLRADDWLVRVRSVRAMYRQAK
jgi:hypothetical protein